MYSNDPDHMTKGGIYLSFFVSQPSKIFSKTKRPMDINGDVRPHSLSLPPGLENLNSEYNIWRDIFWKLETCSYF